MQESERRMLAAATRRARLAEGRAEALVAEVEALQARADDLLVRCRFLSASLAARQDREVEALVRAERERAAADIAARDLDLRVYSSQLRLVRGTLHSVGTDGFLDARQCHELARQLDDLATDVREHRT